MNLRFFFLLFLQTRCNDVLELVQTTRHFRLLADAAEVGGAGSQSLDALVKEIHNKYSQAMEEFFAQVSNVLSIDGTQAFEKAFFTFRTIVKVCEISGWGLKGVEAMGHIILIFFALYTKC